MPENVIYYFSGTGNSLRAALSIQNALGECAVLSMGTAPAAIGKVESIGFVFPCYFGGVPQRVLELINGLDFSGQQHTYIYAVVTYGAIPATTLGQFNAALNKLDGHLDYGAILKAFSNFVVLYDMSEKVAEKTAQTKNNLAPITEAIKNRDTTGQCKTSGLVRLYNRVCSKDVATLDKNFVLRAACNGCGLCERVCPVRNVRMVDGKPSWLGHCEQCLACLQWCPQRAIDYGEKTRKRGRYTNPEITAGMFVDYLNGAGWPSEPSEPTTAFN